MPFVRPLLPVDAEDNSYIELDDRNLPKGGYINRYLVQRPQGHILVSPIEPTFTTGHYVSINADGKLVVWNGEGSPFGVATRDIAPGETVTFSISASHPSNAGMADVVSKVDTAG